MFHVWWKESIDLKKEAVVEEAICKYDEQRCSVLIFIPCERNKNEWTNTALTKKRGMNVLLVAMISLLLTR